MPWTPWAKGRLTERKCACEWPPGQHHGRDSPERLGRGTSQAFNSQVDVTTGLGGNEGSGLDGSTFEESTSFELGHTVKT